MPSDPLEEQPCLRFTHLSACSAAQDEAINTSELVLKGVGRHEW
jgi:hypothetical protein